MKHTNYRLALLAISSNIVEWYDFVVFAYLAKLLSILFFTNDQSGQVKVFLVFGVSYLARPIGSIFFGALSDRISRALSLKMSLYLMIVCSLLMAALPTRQMLGDISMLILLFVRLLQGFSAGGELPTLSTYIYEAAGPKNRATLTGFVNAGSLAGVMIGSLTVYCLYSALGDRGMLVYGWRLAFLVGIILALPSLVLLRHTDLQERKLNRPRVAFMRSYSFPTFLKCISCVAALQVVFYGFFVWMPSYAELVLNYPSTTVHLANTLALLTMLVIVSLTSFFLRDRIQTLKTFLCGAALTFLLLAPAFYLINHAHSSMVFTLNLIVAAIFVSLMDAPILFILNSNFEYFNRGMLVNLAFTIPSVFLGGLTPLILTWLVKSRLAENWWIPAMYISFFLQ